jgi:hypothetical protein
MSVIHRTLTEFWQTMDERILVDKSFPRPVTTGSDKLTRNLNELRAQRLHPIWLHSLRQAEAAQPIVDTPAWPIAVS